VPESADREEPARGRRRDNLQRAIFDAWDKGLCVSATASEVFDYLAKKDDTGLIRYGAHDDLTWITTDGYETQTSLKALANRLTKYRKEYDKMR
jgi:hypothetical protein